MNRPNSLSELVEIAIRHRDTSGLGLSQLAAKKGTQLTATTINQIRQGLYKSKPREGTIRALAWLAGVSGEVAFMAAGQPVPGPPFAEELPPGVDNLPPKTRKAAIDMLRVLVDMNKDVARARNPLTDIERHRKVTAHKRSPRLLRQMRDQGASGPERGNSGLEQKTEQPRAADYHDNNIPLPEDYLDLAAHPATESSGRREHGEANERGERFQERQG